MENLKVATVQFQHQPGDKAANLQIIQGFAKAASEQGAELVLFPECCISGYWHLRKLTRDQLMELAEPIPSGNSTKQLQAWADELQISICAGLVEIADGGKLYNSQVLVMPGREPVWHRKLHCFISEHMSSGDHYTVAELPTGHRVGILICYDNNLVENARATRLAGAEILLAPHQTGGCQSGSPFAMGRVDVRLWEQRHEDPKAIEDEFRGDKGRGWLMRWLPARAHDNGLYLLFSNGVGQDDDEVRTGNAMILDPYGRVVIETWEARDQMLVAELDGSLQDRATGTRWLKARRPELYGSLCENHGEEKDIRKVRFDFQTQK